MGFVPAFGRAFQPPFATAGAAAAAQWWLSGGIAAANCIAAYTPKGAANLAASYDNNAAPGNGLPDGTYDAAPGVAPGWAAGTGWIFNGLNQYLTTGYIPPGGQVFSVAIQVTNVTGMGAAILHGTFNATDTYVIFVRPAWFGQAFYSHGAGAITGVSIAAGNVIIAGARVYRNGVDEGVALGAGVGVPTRVIWIGGANPYGQYCAYECQAFAMYDVILTAPQALALETAMAAL